MFFFFFKRERPGAVRDRIRHWVMSGRYINVPVSLLLLLLPTKSNYRYISVCSVFSPLLFSYLYLSIYSLISTEREKKKKNCVSRTELLPLLLGYGWGCPIWDLSLSRLEGPDSNVWQLSFFSSFSLSFFFVCLNKKKKKKINQK